MTLLPALALAAWTAWGAPNPLKVLSFNAAGVPLIHAKINQRMSAIGAALQEGAYDIVTLQEVWRDSDAEILRMASGLPHHYRSIQNWPFGDGLLILSRYPILESAALRFSERSEHSLFKFDGELLAHKGAILARVDAPGGPVDVYDTHFVADYKTYTNANVRRSQLGELVEWVQSRSQGRPVILTGDLNIRTGDPEQEPLLTRLGLRDVCLEAPKERCADPRRARGRIDYILVTQDSPPTPEARLALGDPVPLSSGHLHLSDHPAVAALLPLPAPLRTTVVSSMGK